MKIGITGSKGLVGSHLCEKLEAEFSAEILAIPRELLYGDPQKLSDFLTGCEMIIHLSGATVVSRWTKKRMSILRDSRILTTQNLSKAIALLNQKPKLFISTSAVGIYNSIDTHTESSTNFADDFLGHLCKDWEHAALQTQEYGVRTVIFRLGVVLSNKGGILGKVLPVFRLGLGGKIGDGKQAFPFIHIQDLMNAYVHVISNPDSKGVYNMVAPELVTNLDFTKTLSSYVKLPAILPVPSVLIRLIYLGGANVLLKGQKVVSERLLSEGFLFENLTLKDSILSFK